MGARVVCECEKAAEGNMGRGGGLGPCCEGRAGPGGGFGVLVAGHLYEV